MFNEEAYKVAGNLAIQNGWVQGGPEATAVHALIGGIMAEMGGGSFTAGASGAGVSATVQNELSKITDPALRQWASAIVGSAAASAADGSAQTGASTAASGTKNNDLTAHEIVINGTALVLAGVSVQMINGQKQLVVAGQAIATWASDTRTWVSDKTQNYIFNKTYPPMPDHTTSTDRKIPESGTPNSSYDRVDDAGNVITRRYYDETGKATKDVDFTDHGNAKRHPEVPHEHDWDWSDPENPDRSK